MLTDVLPSDVKFGWAKLGPRLNGSPKIFIIIRKNHNILAEN